MIKKFVIQSESEESNIINEIKEVSLCKRNDKSIKQI